MTTETMTDLCALAEAATPGPWTLDGRGWQWWIASCGIGDDGMAVWSPNSPTPDHDGEREDDGGEADRRNAAYIAAVSPDVVLALLDERDALRAAAKAVLDWDEKERWAGPHDWLAELIGYYDAALGPRP
jgi:hypothetical protein